MSILNISLILDIPFQKADAFVTFCISVLQNLLFGLHFSLMMLQTILSCLDTNIHHYFDNRAILIVSTCNIPNSPSFFVKQTFFQLTRLYVFWVRPKKKVRCILSIFLLTHVGALNIDKKI